MSTDKKLAVHGGAPAKTVPYGKGLRFGKAEEEAVVAAVRSQKLWYKQGGTRVPAVEQTIGRLWGVEHAVVCSSGSAALHMAVVMCGVEAGDEVIVNPITDWGSVCGILAVGAVPVFADICEETLSMDPACVRKAITPKTRAILLVHQSGFPAHVREIVALARERGLKVIEDCAQSPLARIAGQAVGTFGDVGAFSTNDSKHVSCGEGGFVVTRDAEMARVGRLFIDKAYEPGKARGSTDVAFLGFNYRMSELAASVLDVQLQGLEEQIRGRTQYATLLMEGLAGVKGLRVLQALPGAQSSYWFLPTLLEADRFTADRATITAALWAEGITLWPALAPASILYATTVLKEKRLYPQGRTAPAAFLQGCDYRPGLCPVAERIAATALLFMVNPFYTPQDAQETAEGIRKVLAFYRQTAE